MGDFGQGMRALAKNATSRASRLASAVESSLTTRSHSPVGGPGGFGIGVPHVPSLSSAPLSSRDLITPGQNIVGRTLSVNHSLYAVDRLLASGGFAEVYLVRNTATQQTLALKKVFTAEKETTDAIRSEIQLMQLFRGHPRFVQLIDSEVSTSPNGAIFLILMEYCPGQLISYLNHRINSRLGEPEVLRIFSDVCEAVAHMHYQNPPVIHRDLKIENVLLGPDGEIKLCDFGSATTKVLMIANIRDVPHYEAEIQKFTTLAFRAPEMVDLYQKKVIGEKADIWALGCLLYGICYYQSPFENTGQLAILGGQYDVPSTPPYSQDLKDLIQFMLEVDPDRRPNIYQVLERTSRIRRVPCPIQNIYPREDPTQLQVQAPEPSYAPQSGFAAGDSPQHARGQPQNFSQPKREIVPMRRGRQRQSDPQHSEAPSPQHPPYQHPAPSTQVPDLNAAFGGPFGPASGQSTGALFDEAFGPASAQGSTQDPFSSAFDDTFGPGAGRAPTARPPSGGLFDDPFGSEVPGVTVAQAPQLAPSAFDDAFGSDPFAPSSPAPAPAPATQARTTSSAFEDAFGSSAQTSLPAPDTPPLPSKAPFGNHLRPISRLGSSDSERQGPESPFLPSPTTPLIAQIEGLHIQAKPTTRKRRPHLSQYRAAWVHRAVAKRVALKSNVRKAVGEVWKVANTSEESCTAWLFAEVGKNISPLDPAANLSALYLLHRVMLEGPRKALAEISQSKVPFFESMRTNFIGQTSREKTYSKKIAVYAKFLTQKLKFHKAHPEFEGTFSLQHFFYDFHRLPREQRGLPFFSPTVVRELMDLFLDLEELKDNMLDSRSGSDQLFFLIAGCLAEEFFAIVTIILHLLSKMKENQQYTQETTGLQGKLTRVHQSLTNFYQAVSEFSSGSLIPLPPVPELPPILAEGRRYDYPQSTGMKHLGRLAQRGVSVASFPEAKIYLPLLKEPKEDTSWMPFCSSRYDSAISSESEAELGA